MYHCLINLSLSEDHELSYNITYELRNIKDEEKHNIKVFEFLIDVRTIFFKVI